jgi:hypothetical protein
MDKKLLDATELENRFSEIEKLQDEVSRILYNKNPFVRFFYFRKATRLHQEADKKLRELFYPYTWR